MFYVGYDQTDGLIEQFNLEADEAPESASLSYIEYETALPGAASDYTVIDGELYREAENGEIDSETHTYYIAYSKTTGMAISSGTVEGASGLEETSEIGIIYLDTNPGDVSDTVVTISDLVDRGEGYTTNSYQLYRKVALSASGDEDSESGDSESSDDIDGKNAVLNQTTDSTGEAFPDTILQIILKQNQWELEIDEDGSTTGYWIYTIQSDVVRQNTVLHIFGLNRGALRADIEWETAVGYIIFRTTGEYPPYEDITIDGMIAATTDTWNAVGRIDAWPQGEWRRLKYRMSDYSSSDIDLVLYPGESTLISTPLDFSRASLWFVGVEWAGNTMISIPQYYINDQTNHFCFRMVNTTPMLASPNNEERAGYGRVIHVNDVILSLVYSGEVGNIAAATESSEAATSQGATDNFTYITDSEIDSIT